MRVIFHDSTDPFFNLAAEEYLLDHADGDVFMIWRNDRSVIVGKNQNTWREVDPGYAREANIAVVRRLTGGGAVFHDLGNVNYTFITSGGEIDFAAFAAPVIRALASLGVKARLGGRNDLVVSVDVAYGGADAPEELKISGSAACVRRTPFGERRMHHGTLLYSADLASMTRVLTPDVAKLRSKGVASVRSRVTNIRRLSPALADVDAARFASLIADFGSREFDAPTGDLTDSEREGIAALADSKYRAWDWNWGASPSFSVSRSRRFPYGAVTVGYDADRGRISDIVISGDFFSTEDVSTLCGRLIGARPERESILELLADSARFIEGSSPQDLCDLITG